jgi:hypothetical protein
LIADNSQRWFGLDLLRLVSFLAIVIFHFTHWAWYADALPHGATFPPWHWLETYARALSFSGFTLCWLYAFLVGWKKPRLQQNIPTLVALPAAWLVFCLMDRLSDESEVFWIWDIYPLLLVSIPIAILAAGESLHRAITLGASGLVLVILWLGFRAHELSLWEQLPLEARQALSGECRNTDLADWPLLPWSGWVFMGFGFGRVAALRPQSLRITRAEGLGWMAGLVLASGWLLNNGSAFFHTRLGSHFACDTFRMGLADFSAHLSWVMCAVRCSLDPRIQARLARSKLAVWISSLQISRNFGFSYFTSYIVTGLMHAAAPSVMAMDPKRSTLMALAVLPLTELMIRVFARLPDPRSFFKGPSLPPLLAALFVLALSYPGSPRWIAITTLALLLAFMRSSWADLGLAAALSWIAWSTLSWVHPDLTLGCLGALSVASCLKAEGIRRFALATASVSGICALSLGWQDPGPTFVAYLRARPSLLEAYHPVRHFAQPLDPQGWVWLENAEGAYFMATYQGWISDGGRLIQNPTSRIARAAVDSAIEAGVEHPRVELVALLTPELCRELSADLAAGWIVARQPVPFGRSPACESVSKPASKGRESFDIRIQVDPFANPPADFGPKAKSLWSCRIPASPANTPTAADTVPFRWMSCQLAGDSRFNSMLFKSRPIRRALALWSREKGKANP